MHTTATPLLKQAELIEQSLQEIEFGKVLELVVPFVMTDRAADHIRSLRPSLDGAALSALHAAIGEIIALRSRGGDLPLERTDDPQRLLDRATIAGAHLTASELLSIVELLEVSRRVAHFIRQHQEEFPHLVVMAAGLVDLRLVERHIRDAVDPTGAVRDDASLELNRLRASIAELTNRLRNKLRRIVQQLGDEELLQDDFYTQRDGRLVVPLKVEYKRSLPGIIHGVSQSGATVFFEPSEVFELNNELAELRSAEEREVLRILQTLTAEVGAHAPSIRAADQALTLLDSLRARVLFAEAYHCHQPTIATEGTIELRKVYHPLLVVRKGRDQVVPLSVTFDARYRGYLISGPNAGGKSIAIKTIGVSVAMALSGIYPLGEVTVSPVTILAAIGDHQSIESNLSTFSSQLVRLRDILSLCNSATLVIVDEICAGTDPNEGSALAAAIIDGVLERGGYIVATTHQFTLKTYALTRQYLLNASMEFDTERLEPTYRFLPGVPGNSYAFELAHALLLPGDVIQRARGYLGAQHEQIEQSIQQLQQLHKELDERYAIAAREQQAAEHFRAQYEDKFRQFKAKYAQLIAAAQAEARHLIEQTRVELRRLRQQAEQGSVESARGQLQQLEQQIAAQRLPSSSPSAGKEPIRVGDYVEVIGTSQHGKVIEVSEKKVVVEIGSVRVSISPDSIRKMEQPPMQQRGDKQRPLKLDAPTHIDLRGLSIADALGQLDRALNDAVLNGIQHLTVIHGTGSGQLRQAIHDFLRGHPLVASFQHGTHGQQTNWGATAITLR